MGLENSIETLAGQYYDAETGLHYNYHRYYDPMTGRYITPDPIGLAGGINLYSYVQNNPVNAVDPLGLLTEAYHEATGGGWATAPPRYNPSANLIGPAVVKAHKYVHQSKIQAGMYFVTGSVVAGIGIYTNNPALIKWGIPVATYGFVTSLIEYGFGGDTSNLPANEIDIIWQIGEGACSNQ